MHHNHTDQGSLNRRKKGLKICLNVAGYRGSVILKSVAPLVTGDKTLSQLSYMSKRNSDQLNSEINVLCFNDYFTKRRKIKKKLSKPIEDRAVSVVVSFYSFVNKTTTKKILFLVNEAKEKIN